MPGVSTDVKTLARKELECERRVPNRGPINRPAKTEVKQSTRSKYKNREESTRTRRNNQRRLVMIMSHDQDVLAPDQRMQQQSGAVKNASDCQPQERSCTETCKQDRASFCGAYALQYGVIVQNQA